MFVEFFFVLFFFLTEKLEATVSVDKKLHIAYRLVELDFFLYILINCELEPWSSKTLVQNS